MAPVEGRERQLPLLGRLEEDATRAGSSDAEETDAAAAAPALPPLPLLSLPCTVCLRGEESRLLLSSPGCEAAAAPEAAAVGSDISQGQTESSLSREG